MRLELTPPQASLFIRLAKSAGVGFSTTAKRTHTRVAFNNLNQAALVAALEVSGYDMGASPVTRDALLRKLKAGRAVFPRGIGVAATRQSGANHMSSKNPARREMLQTTLNELGHQRVRLAVAAADAVAVGDSVRARHIQVQLDECIAEICDLRVERDRLWNETDVRKPL